MKKNATDQALLNWFQKVSDKIQLAVGLTNFHLAKIFLTLGIAAFVERSIERVLRDGWNAFNLLILAIGTVFYVYITHRINIGEKNCHQNPHFKSELAISFTPYRWMLKHVVFYSTILMVIQFVMPTHPPDESAESIRQENLIFVLLWLSAIMEFIAFYFASCTPKPKQPSKLRQFIQSISLKPQFKPA